jgi:hypothetical protein
MKEYNLQGKFTYNSSDSDSKMYMQFNVVNVVVKRLKYWCLVSIVDNTHHITEVVMRRE